MIRASLLRGLAAGLVAGVLAGLVGLAVGEPSLEAAIALEEAGEAPGGSGAAEHAGQAAVAPHGHDGGATFSRPVQRAGLVAGSVLLGSVLGLAFGVASAWAVGRLDGDGWTRSLRLGAVAAAALAVLPALLVPANPPGIGDPATVGARTTAHLTLAASTVLVAAAGRLVARDLARRGVHRAVRQVALGAAAVLAVAGAAALGPPAVATDGFPADILWRYRLGALATQLTLHGGIAVVFGLLTVRAERPGRVPAAMA